MADYSRLYALGKLAGQALSGNAPKLAQETGQALQNPASFLFNLLAKYGKMGKVDVNNPKTWPKEFREEWKKTFIDSLSPDTSAATLPAPGKAYKYLIPAQLPDGRLTIGHGPVSDSPIPYHTDKETGLPMYDEGVRGIKYDPQRKMFIR